MAPGMLAETLLADPDLSSRVLDDPEVLRALGFTDVQVGILSVRHPDETIGMGPQAAGPTSLVVCPPRPPTTLRA